MQRTDPVRTRPTSGLTARRGNGRPQSTWPRGWTKWGISSTVLESEPRRTSLVARVGAGRVRHLAAPAAHPRPHRRRARGRVRLAGGPVRRRGRRRLRLGPRCGRHEGLRRHHSRGGPGADAHRAPAAPVPVRLVFTADEEAGGPKGSAWLTENHPDLLAGLHRGDRGGGGLLAHREQPAAVPRADSGEGNRLAEADCGRHRRSRIDAQRRQRDHPPRAGSEPGRVLLLAGPDPPGAAAVPRRGWRMRSASGSPRTTPSRPWPGSGRSRGWSVRPCRTRPIPQCWPVATR